MIEGHTLHSLLSLPVKGDFKELQGERLHQMQQSLADKEYLIIDEMSMVGRKFLDQVDRRLRQVFPHRADTLFGGCSCLLFGDFGQLPPVIDLPLYTIMSHSPLSDHRQKKKIDIGKKEFSAGLTFVACSRVRRLKDLLFSPPFPFQQISLTASAYKMDYYKMVNLSNLVKTLCHILATHLSQCLHQIAFLTQAVSL